MGLRFEPFFPAPEPLLPNQKWHVFVSYRSDDRRWTLKLHDALRHLKYVVFVDQLALSAGSGLPTSLAEAIDGSVAGVIVWSKNYQTSNWTTAEYNALEARRIQGAFRLTVARLDDTQPSALLAGNITTDFRDQPGGPCGLPLLRLTLGLLDRPLPPGAVEVATEIDAARKRYLTAIETARMTAAPDRLIELARSTDEPWRDSPILGCAAAEGLIAAERFAAADEVLGRLRVQFPEAVRPRQLEALSAKRRGNWQQAQDILGTMYVEGLRDAETVGMYAATWWSRYDESRDRRYVLLSRNHYLEAFTLDPKDYYTGINAASKSLFLGERDTAKTIAARVETILQSNTNNDYYELATLGELKLLQEDYAAAARSYESAVLRAPAETGNHTGTRNQARDIMDALGTGPADRAIVEQPFAHLEASRQGV